MADEHPRDDAGSADQPAPDRPSPDRPSPDQPTGRQPGEESTEPEPSDETARPPSGAGDETAVGGPPDAGPSGTAVMPAVPEPPKWTARAAVPPPKPAEGGWDETSWQQPDWDQPDAGWQEDGPSQPRRALTPILVSLLVLVLLAILAFGIWLVVRARNDETPAPGGSGTPSATSGTTAPPTTPPPTTGTPTPQATSPQPVLIPDVLGQDFESAASRLQQLGLQVTRSNRPSTAQPAGRVIGTDPAIGSAVLPGTNVAVIVSTGPPTPSPTRTPSPTPTVPD